MSVSIKFALKKNAQKTKKKNNKCSIPSKLDLKREDYFLSRNIYTVVFML